MKNKTIKWNKKFLYTIRSFKFRYKYIEHIYILYVSNKYRHIIYIFVRHFAKKVMDYYYLKENY